MPCSGYSATIYFYKLQLFGPSWLIPGGPDLKEGLLAQMACKDDEKFPFTSAAYLRFLELGGELCLEDLTPCLLRRTVKRSIPVITGLSSTYRYRTQREYWPNNDYDHVRGFCFQSEERKMAVTECAADRCQRNPRGHRSFAVAMVQEYFSGVRARTRTRNSSRYELAMLVNSDEKDSPSNGRALKNFMRAANRKQVESNAETFPVEDVPLAACQPPEGG